MGMGRPQLSNEGQLFHPPPSFAGRWIPLSSDHHTADDPIGDAKRLRPRGATVVAQTPSDPLYDPEAEEVKELGQIESGKGEFARPITSGVPPSRARDGAICFLIR